MRARLEATAELWPVGSYLPFFLASALTQLLFWVLHYYRYATDFTDRVDFVSYQWSTGAIILTITMGWLMLAGMGIAWNLWPIIYRHTPFSPSLPRAALSMNVAGQVLVFISHLLFEDHRMVAVELLTVGVALLCLSAFIAASPAWAYYKSGAYKHLKFAWLPLLPAGFTMMLSFTTAYVWGEFLITEEFSFFSRGLYLLFNIDLLWMAGGFACVVGHLQRRMEWDLLEGWRGSTGLAILALTFGIHSIVMFLDHTIWNDKWWIELPFILPLFWMLMLLGPGIAKRIASPGHQAYNRAVVASMLWMPIIIVFAGYEALYTNNGLTHSRYLLLFGFGLQSVFGFCIWMHQDHKHLKENRRRQPWVFIIALNASLILHVMSALSLDEFGVFKLGPGPDLVAAFELTFLLAAMLTWLGWWIYEILFGLHDWQKEPMFYSTIHQEPDPYVFESE